MAAILVGSFAAAFLIGVNIDSPRDSQSYVGNTAIAAAEDGDCLDHSAPLWDWIIDGLNWACRTLRDFGKFLADKVLGPIGDWLWKAFNQNRFCTWRTSLDPDDSASGLNGLMMSANDLLIGANDVGETSTTWQQYGTAGTYWSTYFLDCFTSGGQHISNAGANFVFTISKVFSMAAILLFQQTFKSTIVDYFFVPQQGHTQPAIRGIIDKLHGSVYLSLAAVAIVIGGLVVLYTSIIRGGGLAEGLSRFGIMAGVAGIAAVYASYGPDLIQKANALTDEVGASIISAIVGENCTNSDGSTVGQRQSGQNPQPGSSSTNPPPSTPSSAPPPNQQAAGRGAGQGQPLAAPGDDAAAGVNAYDCAAQTMYDILIFRPWANGEIGTVEVMGDPQLSLQRKRLAMDILRQQSYSKQEIQEINAKPKNERFDEERKRRDQKRQDRLAMVKSWGARFKAADGEPEAPFEITGENAWRPYDHVETDYPEYWPLFSGALTGQRFVTAIMALIAAVAMAMVLSTVACAYLVLQLMTIILAMVAPVVFLAALVPIFGTRVLMRWFEMLGSMFIKRLALVIFVGLLLAGLQLVFKLQIPWWLQLLFVILVAMVGVSYRNQVSQWVTGGLESMGKMAGGATGGLLGMRDAAKGAKEAKQTVNATQGMPAGARAKAGASSAYGGPQPGGGPQARTPEGVRQGGRNQGNRPHKGERVNQRSGAAQPHQPRPRNASYGDQPPRAGQRPGQGGAPPDGSQVGVRRTSRNNPYMYEGS